MRIADGELRNVVNGATLRFRRRCMRQNPRRKVFDPALVQRKSHKTESSFVLPYGRATNRTRRSRSETLWMNRGTPPSYTFKKNRRITSRNGEILPIICGKTQLS